MKLSDLGEFGLIRRIAAGCQFGDPARILQGIGDDAAAVLTDGRVLLVTADLMVERVHFMRGRITPYQLGYKSVAVSLSDIAAMGAAPLDIFISIAVPEDVPVEELDDIFRGMKDIARTAGANILGGDTTASRQDLVINSTVTGAALPQEILYRHAARPGDAILVSGNLGDSAGGLHIALHQPDLPPDTAAALLQAHCQPALHLREARILACSGSARAGIDLSDGLSSDLGHICRASACGAELDETSLPLSSALRDLCRRERLDPLRFALSGGEDYHLLVTVDPAAADDLIGQIREETGVQFHQIGRIIAGDHVRLRRGTGSLVTLSATGHDHFPQERTAAGDQ